MFEHPDASWQHRNCRVNPSNKGWRGGRDGCRPNREFYRIGEVQQTMQMPLVQGMTRRMIRRIVLSLLIFTLVIPPGELSAWAQDKDKQAQQTQPAPQGQQAPGFSISVTVPVVSVDAVVTDNNGNYLKDLKKENFRISEDGTVQTITNFAPSEAPITIVLLLDFSKLGYQFFT